MFDDHRPSGRGGSTLDVRALTDASASYGALKALVTWSEYIDLAYAWASSSDGTAAHWKTMPLEKVRRAIVGIHFAQTEPHVLRELQRVGVLRVVADTAGVFHPKLLIGVRGSERRALVGSSNLTTAGFAANAEVNLLLAGSSDAVVLKQLAAFIDEQWSSPRAFEPDNEWLAQYELLYAARPAAPNLPAKLAASSRILASAEIELIVRKSWFTGRGGGHGITVTKPFCRSLGISTTGPNTRARVFVADTFVAEGALTVGNARLSAVDGLLDLLRVTATDIDRTTIRLRGVDDGSVHEQGVPMPKLIFSRRT